MRKQIEQCANRNRVRADMRKCGNMCLYRSALTGVLAVFLAVEISACGGKAKPGQETGVSQKAEITQEKASAPVWKEMRPERSMELSYAKQFSVDYYDGGYDLIQVQDDSTCLVVPEGAAVPEGLPASITVLQKPLDHVYLAATSAMDLIAAWPVWIGSRCPERRSPDGMWMRPDRLWKMGHYPMRENTAHRIMSRSFLPAVIWHWNPR